MVKNNLSSLRICVEKPLEEDEAILKQIYEKKSKKLQAAFYTKKLWPKNSTIKISFNSNPSNVKWTSIAVLKSQKNASGNKVELDPLELVIRELSPVEAIKKVVKERIQPIVGLKLVFLESGGDVRISFDPSGGSWSLVGTDCIKTQDDATMNFGWLDCGTIIHEFGHAIGLLHEHQNPKGEKIDWNEDKVYAWAKKTQGWDKETTYRNIIEKYDVNELNATNFDPSSIMLYFFPGILTNNNRGTNANYILSKTDIEHISKIYPGGFTNPDDFYKEIEKGAGKKFNTWNGFIYFVIGLIVIFFIMRYLINATKEPEQSSSLSSTQ